MYSWFPRQNLGRLIFLGLSLLGHSHALQNSSEQIDIGDTESVQTSLESKKYETANTSRLSSQLSVYIEEYQFYGNTAFSDDELIALTLPYCKRKIYTEELIELKDKITNHYVTRGFINSGAILPDQEIKDGIIVFQIQEGFIEETQILKKDRLAPHYILNRIESGTRQPLNIFELQKTLKILEQDSNVESIQATLEPGTELGSGILSIEVQEPDLWDSGFEINNYSTANIGQYNAMFYTNASNLTGLGDSLEASIGWRFGDDVNFSADESIFYRFYGSIPLNSKDTTLSASFSKNASIIINENVRDLDIQNEIYDYSAEIRHPVYRTQNQEFGLAAKLTHTDNSTTLSGKPASSGSGQPTDRVTKLSFTQDWVYRSQKEVFALYSSVDFGIDFLDATMDETHNNPDASFVTWLLQSQYLRQLQYLSSQILLKGTLRLSDSAVLPTEKFTLGGVFSVRGYRENTLTKDYGALANIEYRVPLFGLKLPHFSKERGDGQVQVIAFYDYGWGRNVDEANGADNIDYIHSVGTGFLWKISQNAFAELYWGHRLKPVDYNDEHDIQEAGVHFRVDLGLF